MKTIKIALLSIAIFTFGLTLMAQYDGVTVSYVKVKPGQVKNFLELEKENLGLHKERVNRGIITSHLVYQKLYSGPADAYNFIVVTHFDDFKKSENPFPKELIDELYTKEEQEAYWKKAPGIRNYLTTEFYDKVSASDPSHPFKYLRLTRLYVSPEQRWTFEQQRKDIIKPLFDEVADREINAGWSLWKKDPSDKKFQYVSVNLFSEFGQWKESIPFDEIFKETFPDKDFEKTRSEVLGNRTAINYEYWELKLSTME